MACSIRVVLADDHLEVLEDIRDILQPEFLVVATVQDGHSLEMVVDELKPDVIVTDIMMPKLNGIDAARALIQKDPDSKVIMLSVHSDPAMVHLALDAGAKGYVLKVKASEELPQAIYKVLHGEEYLSPSIGLLG